ncbi:FAD-dependent monooxygenase, partial [Streptomyces roseoverticillatus]|uniref:FAD-dependent monooxygenase n=1 Tax=Streptomyces roseoverticillatus TaxID=66429 RepID=UPI001F2BE2D4
PIVAFPYPYPGQWRLIDTSNEAETGEQAPTIERFERLFSEFVPDMAVERAGWTSLFRIHRRLVERYRLGRILLMGDAAHIHSPASGQGLN